MSGGGAAADDAKSEAARFFKTSDDRADSFVFPLPGPWWSRPYEYAWCAGFAKPDDVVLDAACGISHPFKFFLADRCREAHACDWDARIQSETEICLDVVRDFGKGAAENLIRAASLSRLQRAHASIAALPYQGAAFDTIFCISVLEHLSEQDLTAALGEFYRTLRQDGRVVLTFDYPTVDLQRFRELAQQQGFIFAGDVTAELPEDAITSDLWGRLYCYRAVLRIRPPQA
ncbi:class I SAM-dependent methyltransferase [Paenibacillus sacheonensis]|uniref:Methyltransferase domain-containing protein n=1 Tax=Paenibacillus sacheonensis TaxID=742054 RepID=A0A7X4YLS1_9BACL|nr:class I SAM-dependent methyltransferase [Paenibacillus sacheonensis]MBM7563931.1 SAM-dependent methyltransferase [Paenibacillus sacheonensis]NBC67724.1 methyltransferase domain-containing protein [Paenibacillus sacheonensis]